VTTSLLNWHPHVLFARSEAVPGLDDIQTKTELIGQQENEESKNSGSQHQQ